MHQGKIVYNIFTICVHTYSIEPHTSEKFIHKKFHVFNHKKVKSHADPPIANTHTQVKENGFADEFWEWSGYLTAADLR